MKSLRLHMRTTASPDAAWAEVTDVLAISKWIPGAENLRLEGNDRIVTSPGGEMVERIMNNDGDLRRLQYTILPGVLPVEHYWATVDVLDDPEGALVIYSIDVTPDAIADMLTPVFTAALANLKQLLES